MTRKLLVSTTLATLLAPCTSPAQTACGHLVSGRTALVHGNQHAFILQAPVGWVPTFPPGVPAAFRRETETWRDGRAVMYVNTATADTGDAEPPEQIIQEDSSRFANGSPSLRVESLPSVRTMDGREALIRRFVGHQTGTFEIVAYVRERTVTPLIVLSARTQADYDTAVTSFYALVHSYEFVTSHIRLSDSLPCGLTRQ